MPNLSADPDIVKWLRDASSCLWTDQPPIPDRLQQAADEIECLRGLISRMMKGGKPPEIRHNDDGTLDEVVAHYSSFHLEQMNDGGWWMSIIAGGVETHVTLYTRRNAKILANVVSSNV